MLLTDLVGETAAITDPVEALPNDQLDALRKVLRLEWIGSQASASQAEALRADLTAQGLDVDALFAARLEIMEQRGAAARALNESLVGQEIRIPGYILPLEFDVLEVVESLLVPTVGACIHTPPSPANQMIHVQHPEGIDVGCLYEAVWITGVMEAEETLQDVRCSDGQAAVEISDRMSPTSIEPY